MDDIRMKGYVKLEFKNQGNFFFALIIMSLGYFGVICNIIMYDEWGNQIAYPDLSGEFLIWTYKIYFQTYFIPVLILFLVCLVLTYKEDIPRYGIKHSLWFVPLIIIQSIIWYWIIYGFNVTPLLLLFTHGEGYLYIFILYTINLSGALMGKKIKELRLKWKQKAQLVNDQSNNEKENN